MQGICCSNRAADVSCSRPAVPAWRPGVRTAACRAAGRVARLGDGSKVPEHAKHFRGPGAEPGRPVANGFPCVCSQNPEPGYYCCRHRSQEWSARHRVGYDGARPDRYRRGWALPVHRWPIGLRAGHESTAVAFSKAPEPGRVTGAGRGAAAGGEPGLWHADRGATAAGQLSAAANASF